MDIKCNKSGFDAQWTVRLRQSRFSALPSNEVTETLSGIYEYAGLGLIFIGIPFRAGDMLAKRENPAHVDEQT